MKNPDPTAIVSIALKRIQSIEDELPQLKKLGSDSTAQLEALELSADLADNKALAEVGRLQILEKLIPRRLAARETALIEGQEALLKTCHDFITVDLGPRCRKLLAKARAKVEKELRPHFREDWQMEQAVANSNTIAEIERIQGVITIRDFSPAQAKKYALQLIQAWSDLDAFEKANLN